MRKILHNYYKSHRLHGLRDGRIGNITDLLDMHGNYLRVGDEISYRKYKGVLLYNPSSMEYGLALDYSMWYGDDKYDIDSYGKFIAIPMDNGEKMQLKKLLV